MNRLTKISIACMLFGYIFAANGGVAEDGNHLEYYSIPLLIGGVLLFIISMIFDIYKNLENVNLIRAFMLLVILFGFFLYFMLG